MNARRDRVQAQIVALPFVRLTLSDPALLPNPATAETRAQNVLACEAFMESVPPRSR
jgi:hypothetical protein